jgi:hypothetical protein
LLLLLLLLRSRLMCARVVGNGRNSFTAWTSCWPCARRQVS